MRPKTKPWELRWSHLPQEYTPSCAVCACAKLCLGEVPLSVIFVSGAADGEFIREELKIEATRNKPKQKRGMKMSTCNILIPTVYQQFRCSSAGMPSPSKPLHQQRSASYVNLDIASRAEADLER